MLILMPKGLALQQEFGISSCGWLGNVEARNGDTQTKRGNRKLPLEQSWGPELLTLKSRIA
jgi:hypothetical protein